MQKLLFGEIHPSWFLVALCVGIICGAVIGIVLKICWFESAIWVIVVVVLFLLCLLKPVRLFLVVSFLLGVVLVLYRVPQVINVENNITSGIDEPVIMMRDFFADRIDSVVPEPENKLGKSYLLGMKTGLPKELSSYLRVVGLTHIVVASGAHLSILVEIARKIFGKISRFSGLLFSVVFIVFFMAMVGWTPSIMRAGLMAILTLSTWYVGRRIAALRMIIIVMAFTLMINPMFLINLGWLLSFASYAGIMLVGPMMTKFFYGNKKPGFVGSMVITTLAATLMTLPITLYYFGTVSLISVIANLLILPTLSMAMGLTFLAGVVASVPGVGEAVGFVATKILDYHIGVISFFGEMKQFLAQMPTSQPWVFLMYILIFLPLIWRWWKKHRRNSNCGIMNV